MMIIHTTEHEDIKNTIKVIEHKDVLDQESILNETKESNLDETQESNKESVEVVPTTITSPKIESLNTKSNNIELVNKESTTTKLNDKKPPQSNTKVVHRSLNPFTTLPINPKIVCTSVSDPKIKMSLQIGGSMQPATKALPDAYVNGKIRARILNNHAGEFSIKISPMLQDAQIEYGIKLDIYNENSIQISQTYLAHHFELNQSQIKAKIHHFLINLRYDPTWQKESFASKTTFTIGMEDIISLILSKMSINHQADIGAEHIFDLDLTFNVNTKDGNQFCVQIKLLDGLICITFTFDMNSMKSLNAVWNRLIENLQTAEIGTDLEIGSLSM